MQNRENALDLPVLAVILMSGWALDSSETWLTNDYLNTNH